MVNNRVTPVLVRYHGIVRLLSLADLTPTQLRVAELVAKGLAYKKIGQLLDIAAGTARAHVNTIAGRLPEDDLSAYRRVMVWMICRLYEQQNGLHTSV